MLKSPGIDESIAFQVKNVNDQIFAFMVSFNVMFGFAFLASSFVIVIVKERINGKFLRGFKTLVKSL